MEATRPGRPKWPTASRSKARAAPAADSIVTAVTPRVEARGGNSTL